VTEKLTGAGFLPINGYCVVNPQYITKIDGSTLWLGNEQLTKSRPKKKEFMAALNVWMGRYSI
jgi:hypothetical protein